MAGDSLRARSQRTFENAQRRYGESPTLPRAVWYGRVLGFRNRFDEAIEVFSEALERFPDSFELLRQRGHRYISTRQFEAGLADLQRAAKLIEALELWFEPDGEDNELPIPRTSIQFNTYYHLGLVHYLLRSWDEAVGAYQRCRDWVPDGDFDGITACLDWMYMALRRKGDSGAASAVLELVPAGLADDAFIEGPSYYRRLLMYQGKLAPEDLLNPERGTQQIHNIETIYATQGYGVGNWYFYNGQTDEARAIFQRILEGRSTSAFGFIAAELDMAEIQVG